MERPVPFDFPLEQPVFPHKWKALMNSQLTSLPMCGFIAQLVQHRTGIAEITGSNPVEALFFFFRLLYSSCLNWKFTAKITYHLHIYPQFIYESFHTHYIISLLSRENMNSQLISLPMCGFIAQLVEHRTGIVEVTGSNTVEALIFFRLLYSNCLNWKFTAKITYHLQIMDCSKKYPCPPPPIQQKVNFLV